MSEGVFLGIDLGTSGARVAALDSGSRPVALAQKGMDAADSSRRDPAVWLAAIETALAELLERLDGRTIEALSVDATSGTVLAATADGSPIGPALMYNDTVDRPDLVRAIGAAAPRESAAHGAASALARAMVLQDRPGATRILHQADWVAEQLAGHPVPSDESNCLKTGYDPVQRRWPDWLSETPLDRRLLPEVVSSGTETARTCGSLGLPVGVPIIAGFTDGCASFWATGARKPGDGVTALGSTMTLELLSDRPVFSPEYGIYSHRIGDSWLAGGASNSGGAALLQFFAPEEIARLSLRIDPETDSGLDYVVLPRPGERFPVADPALAPRLTPRPDDDAAFLHGLLEGIARTERLGYRRLSELGAPPLACIRSVGGGAANDCWTRLRVWILGVPPAPALSGEAAAGTARLAMAGAGAAI